MRALAVEKAWHKALSSPIHQHQNRQSYERRGMETKLFPVGWARDLKMAALNKVDIIATVSTYELKNISWSATQSMGPKFTASFFVSGKKDVYPEPLPLPDNSSICVGVRPGLKLTGINDPEAFINESMLALKNDGTYERILKSYGQMMD
jgi:ABC-type amino acid transport substrate-binding protein